MHTATNESGPVIALLAIIIGGWLVAMVFFVLRDKKWRVRRGVSDGTDGRFSVTIPVSTSTPFNQDAMVRIAYAAVTQAGGQNLTVTGNGAVVGWTGSPWVNIARWAEYQMVVVISQQSDGSGLFLCRCRPRNPLTFPGSGISAEIAQRLAAQVASLVAQ